MCEDAPSAVIDELQKLHPKLSRAELEEIYLAALPLIEKFATALADLPEGALPNDETR